MEIKIICSGKQEIYHDYFKPFLCTSNIDLPSMYNQGYNSFRFKGGEPNFTGENMPKVFKRESNSYKFFEAARIVLRQDKTSVIGNYYLTENKITGEIKETFCFD